MLQYSPIRTNKNALFVTIFLFSTAAIFLIASVSVPYYRGIFQILFLIAAVAGIQLTTRYLLCNYHYILDNTDNKNDLMIVKTQGKKRTIVCNISLETALGIVPKDKMAVIERDFGKIDYHFNYCETMFPENASCYIFEYNEKRAVMTFEPNEIFLEEFRLRLPVIGI